MVVPFPYSGNETLDFNINILLEKYLIYAKPSTYCQEMSDPSRKKAAT
jgi:hypothetical protein